MSSLYGNIKKVASSTFQFDRVYSSRKQMDAAAATDGVYAGRYVLVEYGERFGGILDGESVITRNEGRYIKVEPNENYDETLKYYVKIPDTENQYEEYKYTRYITWLNDIEEKDIYYLLQPTYYLVNNEDGSMTTIGNVVENQYYLTNANLDLYQYGSVYDSTVWQKVYVQGTNKYVMVAELNAQTPKMHVIQERPITFIRDIENPDDGLITGKFNDKGEIIETVRLVNAKEKYNSSHFDLARDTELTYNLRTPIPMKVKVSDNTVDINRNGFNMVYSFGQKPGTSQITWIPEELENYEIISGQDAYGNPLARLIEDQQVDTKALYMNMPAFGNIMDTLYNLLYGTPQENDLSHGVMRPYFKRFIDRLVITQKVVVEDENGELKTVTNDGNPIYCQGTVGTTISPIFNASDIQGLIEPSFIVAKYKIIDDYGNATYYDLPYQGNGEGSYVLFNNNTQREIMITFDIPTGEEAIDISWTSDIPELNNILANNTAGLATVLSSLFSDIDPLTGTIRYYLYNDWTLEPDEDSSGPTIANKPLIIGGYKEKFTYIPGTSGPDSTQTGNNGDGHVGYWKNLGGNGYIPFPHTEITTSTTFSGGHYSIDFDTWQLVRISD